MAKAQRKEEILKSELPPPLPLMALRSTIVYPLGTIAVQMGAPENLSLLRAHDEAGLIVALVVASGDHDEPIDASKFAGRVGVAARRSFSCREMPPSRQGSNSSLVSIRASNTALIAVNG